MPLGGSGLFWASFVCTCVGGSEREGDCLSISNLEIEYKSGLQAASYRACSISVHV